MTNPLLPDPLFLAFVAVALFSPFIAIGAVIWMCRNAPEANDMRVIRRGK